MSSTKPRHLLYFSATMPAPELISVINDANWVVKVANNVNDVASIIKIYAPKVAIAYFDTARELLTPAVKNLFRQVDSLEWVGLITDSCKDNLEIKHVIGESFHDFHTLPVTPQTLLGSIGHAYGMAQIKLNVAINVTGTSDVANPSECNMVGTSPIMLELFKHIRKVASVDAPVLITGETGTGKELAALALHERSRRHNKPFVAVNCGALPSGLIQSELFGHEKGAFTGASQLKIGRIESAIGGTIFLDEIGDLPVELQVNLLRFLQEGTIERVGSNTKIHVDVRVIAATHVNLEEAVAKGEFREDLYYRLSVLQLKTPALMHRLGDIDVLAHYFFNLFLHEKRRNIIGFSPAALSMMNQYSWPGNVRELINRIRRALVMCERRLITPEDLNLDRRLCNRETISLNAARNIAEADAIRQALQKNHHNLTSTSHDLCVSRVTLYRLIQKYKLSEVA